MDNIIIGQKTCILLEFLQRQIFSLCMFHLWRHSWKLHGLSARILRPLNLLVVLFLYKEVLIGKSHKKLCNLNYSDHLITRSQQRHQRFGL